MNGESHRGVIIDRSLWGKLGKQEQGDTGRCWGPRHKSGVQMQNCRTSEDGKGSGWSKLEQKGDCQGSVQLRK